MTAIADAAPEGLVALVNSGGAVLGMGTCLDAYRLPSGMCGENYPAGPECPAWSMISPARGIPVINI